MKIFFPGNIIKNLFDYVLNALQSLYDKEHFKNKQALGDWEFINQAQTALHMMISSILTSTAYSNRPNWVGDFSLFGYHHCQLNVPLTAYIYIIRKTKMSILKRPSSAVASEKSENIE